MSDLTLDVFLSTVAYAGLGILLFVVAYFVCDLLSPFSFRKEIEEDQNVALGIVLGSMFIGIAIIIAAALS